MAENEKPDCIPDAAMGEGAAMAFLAAMRLGDPSAFIGSGPLDGRVTIDGHFDLAIVLRALSRKGL